ncbi:hypothetical protein [Pseudomonas costantinii]|nr:hypothetical protein [Pseudomonas costantinii]
MSIIIYEDDDEALSIASPSLYSVFRIQQSQSVGRSHRNRPRTDQHRGP